LDGGLPVFKRGLQGIIEMRNILIVIGIVFIAVGILWPFIGKLPLGRLPGDIVIDRPNMKIYIPITTMVLISVILSILIAIFKK
jgi:hypothetical protein